MTWFFTADLHFDHPEIIKHCNRPFKAVLEMNIALIENWNNRVRKNDTVGMEVNLYIQYVYTRNIYYLNISERGLCINMCRLHNNIRWGVAQK